MNQKSTRLSIYFIVIVLCVIWGSNYSKNEPEQFKTKEIIPIPSDHSGVPIAQQSLVYRSCNPISIDNDSDFVNFATEYNLTGDGSSENPYIIEFFNFSQSASNAFSLRNSSVSFEFRNNIISTGAYGIYLKNVTNGKIIQNRIVNTTQDAIYAENIINISISMNEIESSLFSGIKLKNIDLIEIENNKVKYNRIEGIHIEIADNISVKSNIIDKNRIGGIYIVESENLQIENNTITDNVDSLSVIESMNINLNLNRLRNTCNGISLGEVTQGIIQNNLIENVTASGIHITGCKGILIQNNTLYQIQFAAIFIEGDFSIAIVDNNIIEAAPPEFTRPIDDRILNESAVQYQRNYFSNDYLPDVDNDGYIDTPFNITGHEISTIKQDLTPRVAPIIFSYPVPHMLTSPHIFKPISELNHVIISWYPSYDLQNHTIQYDLMYALNDSEEYIPLVANISEKSYQFDLRFFPNHSRVQFKIIAYCETGLNRSAISENTAIYYDDDEKTIFDLFLTVFFYSALAFTLLSIIISIFFTNKRVISSKLKKTIIFLNFFLAGISSLLLLQKILSENSFLNEIPGNIVVSLIIISNISFGIFFQKSNSKKNKFLPNYLILYLYVLITVILFIGLVDALSYYVIFPILGTTTLFAILQLIQFYKIQSNFIGISVDLNPDQYLEVAYFNANLCVLIEKVIPIRSKKIQLLSNAFRYWEEIFAISVQNTQKASDLKVKFLKKMNSKCRESMIINKIIITGTKLYKKQPSKELFDTLIMFAKKMLFRVNSRSELIHAYRTIGDIYYNAITSVNDLELSTQAIKYYKLASSIAYLIEYKAIINDKNKSEFVFTVQPRSEKNSKISSNQNENDSFKSEKIVPIRMGRESRSKQTLSDFEHADLVIYRNGDEEENQLIQELFQNNDLENAMKVLISRQSDVVNFEEFVYLIERIADVNIKMNLFSSAFSLLEDAIKGGLSLKDMAGVKLRQIHQKGFYRILKKYRYLKKKISKSQQSYNKNGNMAEIFDIYRNSN
jgi:parallel beta-helix repeat protein